MEDIVRDRAENNTAISFSELQEMGAEYALGTEKGTYIELYRGNTHDKKNIIFSLQKKDLYPLYEMIDPDNKYTVALMLADVQQEPNPDTGNILVELNVSLLKALSTYAKKHTGKAYAKDPLVNLYKALYTGKSFEMPIGSVQTKFTSIDNLQNFVYVKPTAVKWYPDDQKLELMNPEKDDEEEEEKEKEPSEAELKAQLEKLQKKKTWVLVALIASMLFN